MKKTILALALLTITLTSCSNNPIEKTEKYIAEGDYEDAIEWLADELEDEPENTLLHALTAEVILNECAQKNCFYEQPEKLESLAYHFGKLKDDNATVDDVTTNSHDRLIKLTKSLITSKHHPKALSSVIDYVPYGTLLQKISLLTFKKASEHIIAGDIPPANTLMQSLSNKIIIKDPNQAFSMLINGYILNDQDIINKSLKNFAKADNSTSLNDEAIIALPYAIFQHVIEKSPKDGTLVFLKEFRNILKIANIPYLNTERGQAKIANAVYAMSRDHAFLDRAKQYIPTYKENTITIDQKDILTLNEVGNKEQNELKELKLKFIKLALLTNPKNQKSWDIFLDPAIEYAKKFGDASILFNEIEPGDIPSSMIKKYNATLFNISEILIEQNQSILDVIQHVILPAEGAANVKSKVTTLLNEAMISAVNKANYDLVYKYASFQPDIARLSRQKVVSITIEALENKWAKNNFKGMDKLSEFLSDTMGIDFSLDSLLLQSFDDFLTQSSVQKELNANSSNELLEDRNTAKVELGDKFTFLQKHFEKHPEVLDNLLKSLIVKSEGTYAIPVSLHKLYTYFSEKFPEKDKYAYLINAIKNSLTEDTELSALEFVKQGQKLQEKYSEIPKSFIVNEALKRVVTLDESRNLWAKSGKEFQKILKNTKPQFSTLMRAVEAYEDGNHEKAASLFTILSDAKLIKQAKPYLQEYVKTVRAQVGAYSLVSNDTSENIFTKLLYIDLINDNPNEKATAVSKTETQNQVDLLAVKVTLISRLGAIKVQSPKDLSEDYGKVSRYEIIGRINPNTMEINIPHDQKSGQGLPLSFEKIFGKLHNLSLEGDRIIYYTEDKEFTFQRINDFSTTKPNFPDGKYAITNKNKNNDERSRHVLPVGSIIEFKTNTRRAINPTQNGVKLSTIYPISGIVRHPSSDKPRPMNGFYSANKQLISFSYTYPLINGGTLDAVIRCQATGTDIICAGHNKHWGRQRYSYIVSGNKVFTKPEPTPSKINRIK